MIIDGKKLAEQVKDHLRQQVRVFGGAPHLAIVLVGNNPVSEKYVGIKQVLGQSLGITVSVHRLAELVTTEEVVQLVTELSADQAVNGVIVQLPLPGQIDRQQALEAISSSKDVDALRSDPAVLSPVVRAIEYILATSQIVERSTMRAVVIGMGKLVGLPVAEWLRSQVKELTVLTEDTSRTERLIALKQADLVVAGAGVPNLVEPEHIKEGVILIDASTSDVGGKLVGDIDPTCADKAVLYTPVPGGVGPLTVVMLFANLLELAARQ